MAKGRFIVLEGIDGAGTTTQALRICNWFHSTREERAAVTQEPSSGPVGALLQQALRKRVHFDKRVMALLFAADRLDHLHAEIQGHLDQGINVICDRYYLSSLAYQMVGVPEDLPWLKELNSKAVTPDLTILIDVPANVAMDRIAKTRQSYDLYERLDFQETVRDNYLMLARQHGRSGERIEVVDGQGDEDSVFRYIRGHVDAM